jgi:hypothetical protein
LSYSYLSITAWWAGLGPTEETKSESQHSITSDLSNVSYSRDNGKSTFRRNNICVLVDKMNIRITAIFLQTSNERIL